MERAARRPLLAAAALTTAGALALSPITATPPEMHALDLVPATVSTQAVRLTDAWSDLFNHTVQSATILGTIFVGSSTTFPLPNPIFIAPIAAQLVINPLIYAVQLATGHGADIPGEIAEHLSKLSTFANLVFTEIPQIIVDQIQTPFIAAQETINFVNAATNKLTALLQAPALFLDYALNGQYGLIGYNGPIAVPIILRNLLATAISTPLPTVTLPFKKAAAAASTPKPTAAAATVTDPADTASSARSKPKTPSSANSKRKASSAKASKKPAAAHGKR
jgi:hypothetical protein